MLSMILLQAGCKADSSDSLQHEQSSNEIQAREEFAKQWQNADTALRLKLADVSLMYEYYDGVSKQMLLEELGQPDELGIDSFNEDVARYDLGSGPEEFGEYTMHITFVFEEEVVIRVMGNFVSPMP